MKSKFVLAALCILPMSVWASMAPTEKIATSALEFQEMTNTRIEIDLTHLRFFTSNIERMTIDNNGNLGIGTITPSYMLDMESAATPRIELHDLTNAVKLDLGADDTRGFVGTSGAHRLDLMTNNTERVTIASDGNVGIGTTSPGLNSKIAVVGGALTVGDSNSKADAAIHIQNSYGGFNRLLQMQPNGNSKPGLNLLASTNALGSHQWWAWGVDTDNVWKIRPGTSFSGSTGMTINSTGNVGIGTTSPVSNSKLDVIGGIAVGGQRAMDSDATNISIGDLAGGDGIRGLSLWAGDLERMLIKSNGDIGIGTASPSYKLHVNGTVRATNFISNTITYADFVFEDDYKLPTLDEVENFIEKNNHLPDIPSEAEAKANGVDLQQMQAKLLQKIEELTLYVIEQNKRIDRQQKRIQKLESEK